MFKRMDTCFVVIIESILGEYSVCKCVRSGFNKVIVVTQAKSFHFHK